MSFSHSCRLGDCPRLATGHRARVARCESALGVTPPEIKPTKQASATVAVFRNGLRVLVSYKTAVAYQLPDGSYVKTPLNQFSRVTDRSVAEFCPRHCVTLDVQAFDDALRGHLSTV